MRAGYARRGRSVAEVSRHQVGQTRGDSIDRDARRSAAGRQSRVRATMSARSRSSSAGKKARSDVLARHLGSGQGSVLAGIALALCSALSPHSGLSVPLVCSRLPLPLAYFCTHSLTAARSPARPSVTRALGLNLAALNAPATALPLDSHSLSRPRPLHCC